MKIIFSFDTTGSMYPALHELRRRLQHVIDPLFATIPDLELGFIAHGDYFDVYEPQFTGYTRNSQLLKEFAFSVGTTFGHGNGGERYEDIMHMVNDLDPDVYIMIADEPPHYKGKRIRTFDVKYDIFEELGLFLDRGKKFYLVRCLNRDDSRKIHAELSKRANTPLLSLHQFTDIPELLSAIVYFQETPATLVEFGNALEFSGKMNVNLATLIDSMLNEQRFSTKAQTKTLSHMYNVGLATVDPTRFQVMHVDHVVEIRDFIESNGIPYKKGRGFYQLTKPELVQEYKEVILKDRAGLYYSGDEARNIIGLPYGERGRVLVDRSLPYDVFIQSTSVNRKLMAGTLFLYET